MYSPRSNPRLSWDGNMESSSSSPVKSPSSLGLYMGSESDTMEDFNFREQQPFDIPFTNPFAMSSQQLALDNSFGYEDSVYGGGSGLRPSPLIPYDTLAPELSSYPQHPRHLPQIHLDTSELGTTLAIPHNTSPMYSPSGNTPQISSGYQSRGSLAHSSPSSMGSLRTPAESPLSVHQGIHPLVVHTPISPGSPSGFNALAPPSPCVNLNAHRTVQEIAVQYSSVYDGPLVPQKTYRPHTQSDRRRYVEEVQLEEPIMFFLVDPSCCGLPLSDALSNRFMRLVGRDDLMFQGRGPSVSIRLMWPGYAPWSRQIPTRDFRSPPGPITRAKLAKNVAKTVQRFIDEMQSVRMEEDADPRWRVGTQYIRLEHLVLVGLQHVSMGSWQAYVRIRTPTAMLQ